MFPLLAHEVADVLYRQRLFDDEPAQHLAAQAKLNCAAL